MDAESSSTTRGPHDAGPAPGRGRKVCVTGASGYIGAHLTRLLMERGYRVRATVRDPANPAKTDFLRQLAEGAEYPLELFAAELGEEGSFDEAMAGCEYACHVASPIRQTSKDPQREIVDPAVHGTLNVLRAAQRAGTVRRVALTSSVAAILDPTRRGDHLFSEEDWNEGATLKDKPYMVSKTLAERAAWDFVEALPDGQRFELVALNPVYVQGPLLTAAHSRGSPSLVRDLLVRKYPACPRLYLGLVDVRDVALAHALALERPGAGGRYILHNGGLWMEEIGRLIAPHFPEHRVPTRRLPDALMYLGSLFDKRISWGWLRATLGRTYRLDNSKAQRELGLRYLPLEQTLLDACRSMVELGVGRPRQRRT